MRFGSDVYRFIFATKRMSAEIDRAFRESVATLPPHERWRRARRPSRCACGWSPSAPGDTVERLASRMAITDRAVERFRVLNGLAPGDRIQPGDQVKIVVE